MKIKMDINKEIVKLLRNGHSYRYIREDIEKKFGIKPGNSKINRLKSKIEEKIHSSQVESDRSFEEEGNKAKVTCVVETPIKTLKELISACEIDEDVWYVEKWYCKPFTTTVKLKGDGKESHATVQNYSLGAFLARRLPMKTGAAFDSLYKKMEKLSPNYDLIIKSSADKYKSHINKPKSRKESLAVFGIMDVHFGKLAWMPETGENYDLRIAEDIYIDCIKEMKDHTEWNDVGTVMIPIGSDFLHLDSPKNQTTRGTVVDVDGRYAKVFEVATMAVIRAIDMLIPLVDKIDLVWVPGNHDTTTSYHLAREIKAWYSKCSSVNVNCDPVSRKYYTFPGVLIGLTHGDEEKVTSLPSLMANEQPNEFVNAITKEWHIGHLHTQKRYMTMPLDTKDGVTVRQLPSLAGTDYWHFKKGYVSNRAAAEFLLYNSSVGFDMMKTCYRKI